MDVIQLRDDSCLRLSALAACTGLFTFSLLGSGRDFFPVAPCVNMIYCDRSGPLKVASVSRTDCYGRFTCADALDITIIIYCKDVFIAAFPLKRFVERVGRVDRDCDLIFSVFIYFARDVPEPEG